MKKILFVTIFSIIIPVSLFAQQSTYFDAPLGGGGGFSPIWIVPQVGKLNDQLSSFGVPKLSTGGFYASGGGGFIYLGFAPFLRVGGMGFSGSTSENAFFSGRNHEVVYSMGGGGLTVEYTLPFIRDVAVSVGAIIGGGSLQIKIYNNTGAQDWGDVWKDANSGSSYNVERTLSNSYWMVSPTLNVDIPFYRFASFRIGAGYQLTFAEKWQYGNNQSLNNVPSGLNGNAFFIQAGVFVGLFSY